jgi:hypothetical protein
MSTISPVFGRMLSAGQIEDQVRASLKRWFPTYLREIERQLGLPKSTFPEPQNYSDRNSFDMEAAEELPKVVVIAPGLTGAPRRKGDGTHEAPWRIGIGIAVGARTEDRANDLVKGYAAAIRGIMLQNSELGNLGGIEMVWADESYDDLPVPNVNQLVKAASLYFDVTFADVVTRGHGPVVPDQDAYNYGEAQTVEVTIEKVEEVTQ